jgi:hypothetical protein
MRPCARHPSCHYKFRGSRQRRLQRPRATAVKSFDAPQPSFTRTGENRIANRSKTSPSISSDGQRRRSERKGSDAWVCGERTSALAPATSRRRCPAAAFRGPYSPSATAFDRRSNESIAGVARSPPSRLCRYGRHPSPVADVSSREGWLAREGWQRVTPNRSNTAAGSGRRAEPQSRTAQRVEETRKGGESVPPISSRPPVSTSSSLRSRR